MTKEQIFATYIKSMEEDTGFWEKLTTEPVKKDEKLIIEHHQQEVNKRYGYNAEFMLKEDFEKCPERWLRGVVAPPTVVEYIGKIEDFSKGGVILFTDDISFITSLNELQLKYDFRVCAPYVDVEGTTNLVMSVPTETGGLRISRMFMRPSYLFPWAAMISDICLWKKGSTEIEEIPFQILEKKELLAVPGNSGSLTNQLIKSKSGLWGLCDCASDIIEAVEKAATLEAGAEAIEEIIKKGEGDK